MSTAIQTVHPSDDAGTAVGLRTRRTRLAATPMELLSNAVATGTDVETMKGLMELQERYERNQARKAFDEAMAAAKAEIPVIVKNRTVDFESKRTDTRTNYKYEDFAQIARTVDAILSKHGLSYRFRTVTEAARVAVTCVLSHRDGHYEETTLSAAHDTSGNKNSIQAIGSAVMYLQRYTLKAALGLAVSNDDDGRSAAPENDGLVVSDEQADEIRKLAMEVGANVPRFLAYMKAESIPDIPAKHFGRAIQMLKAKGARQ